MGSRIPLIGMVHLLDVIRKVDADDGYGGIYPGKSTYLYEKVKGRVTNVSDQDEQFAQGVEGVQRWRIILVPSPQIQNSDFIRLNKHCIFAPIPQDQLYRVIQTKHNIDDWGQHHHTSLLVELE